MPTTCPRTLGYKNKQSDLPSISKFEKVVYFRSSLGSDEIMPSLSPLLTTKNCSRLLTVFSCTLRCQGSQGIPPLRSINICCCCWSWPEFLSFDFPLLCYFSHLFVSYWKSIEFTTWEIFMKRTGGDILPFFFWPRNCHVAIPKCQWVCRWGNLTVSPGSTVNEFCSTVKRRYIDQGTCFSVWKQSLLFEFKTMSAYYFLTKIIIKIPRENAHAMLFLT